MGHRCDSAFFSCEVRLNNYRQKKVANQLEEALKSSINVV
jgi:hypothetical protein